MKQVYKDNRGIAHLVILLALVVVAAIGGVGYYVYSKQKSDSPSLTSQAASKVAQNVAAAKCDIDDKDICKFLSSWKDTKYYRVVSESVTEGKKSTSSYDFIAPDKFHSVMTGEFASEMISIGNTIFTKDPADNKWWKQTVTPDQKKKYEANDDLNFIEDTKEDAKPEQKTVYKLIGKDACGKLQCFKYQVIEPGAGADIKQYTWFDTKDYQLRRTRNESAGGYDDSTYSYDKLTINAPSPVKELKPNQVVVPGQSEPVTAPTQADIQRLIDEAAADQSQSTNSSVSNGTDDN